jgi:peptide/nickel transport system substrate-binding protein
MARVDSFMSTYQAGEPAGDRYGGVVVVGTVSPIAGGMNAFYGAEAAGAQHQMFVNLMTLIQYDESLQPVPYLAESWEVSEDGTELTFRLRRDVYWHDGEITTAHDVEFTFLRATDPGTAYPNASFFGNYVSGPTGVEVVDSFTVTLRLRPHADYLDPWRALAIMPRHLLEEVPPGELSQHPFGEVCPVGNGPFRFLTNQRGERWTFGANLAFPEGLGGRPLLDRYIYRYIPEHSTLLADLLTGSVDVYVAPLPSHYPRILEEESLRSWIFTHRGFSFVAWNSRRPQLSDVRVRRALTLGLNRPRILEAVRPGLGELANAGVPRTHWAFDASLADSLPFDPDQARILLDQAGWIDRDGDGVRENESGDPLSLGILTNDNQEREEVAAMIQAQLAELGVEVHIRVLRMEALLPLISPPDRDFDGLLISFDAEFRQDDTDLFHSESEGIYAFSGTKDAELDRLLDTLQLVTNRDAAVPLWREYQNRIIQLQPYTFLYFADRPAVVNRRLQGVIMDTRGEWLNIRQWWIPAEARRTPSGN